MVQFIRKIGPLYRVCPPCDMFKMLAGWFYTISASTLIAFYVNLYRTVIGPSGFLMVWKRSDIHLSRIKSFLDRSVREDSWRSYNGPINPDGPITIWYIFTNVFICIRLLSAYQDSLPTPITVQKCSAYVAYRIYPKYSHRKACKTSVNPDQMPHSDQGLSCLAPNR